jgi:DNA-binding transcriptional LysR family regulator
MLDLHRLRLLRELKHRGTLVAVADALSYTPSAISQQLSLLESEAGVPLLERVGRRVQLTAQAQTLVAHTEALLQRLEQAEADLAASTSDITGTLRVASFQTAALALIPPALSRLAHLHPHLRVEVTQMEPEDSLPALVARRFDLVVGEEYPGHPGPRAPEVELEDLIRDPMRLALPEARTRTSALSDLRDQSWVMEPEGTAARSWATAVCRDAGFEPDVRYTSPDLLLHIRLVTTGHAAALLPDLASSQGPHLTATLRPLPGNPARRIFTAVRAGAGTHPAVTAVRAGLREATKTQGTTIPTRARDTASEPRRPGRGAAHTSHPQN